MYSGTSMACFVYEHLYQISRSGGGSSSTEIMYFTYKCNSLSEKERRESLFFKRLLKNFHCMAVTKLFGLILHCLRC